MPFITEELWQHLTERREGESIMYAQMPVPEAVDSSLLDDIALAKEIITSIRAVRAKKNIPARESLTLNVIGSVPARVADIVAKLGNIGELNMGAKKDAAAASFLVGTLEFNIPLAAAIDVEAEIARLDKEIDYLQGFKASIEKKLSNERFVNNAPAAVVEGERKKLADTLTKLHANIATRDALKH